MTTLLRVSSGHTVLHQEHFSWETEEHFQAWANGSARQAHAGERAKPVSTGASLLEFEVVQSAGPRAGE